LFSGGGLDQTTPQVLIDCKFIQVEDKSLGVDLLSLPVGTPGQAKLTGELKQFRTDDKAFRATLTADLNTVDADSSSSLSDLAALATFKTDVFNGHALLKADYKAILKVLDNHPTLGSSNVQTIEDQATFFASWDTVKAVFPVLEADLASY
jgi:hypothetical protein